MTLINLLCNDRTGEFLRSPCGFLTDVRDYIGGDKDALGEVGAAKDAAVKAYQEELKNRKRSGSFYFTGLDNLLGAMGSTSSGSSGSSNNWINYVNAGLGIYSAISGAYNANKANDNAMEMNAANIALQRETNLQNMQLAREYNQSQENIANAANESNMQRDLLSYERQRQLAFDMFNAENEYNTPAKQVERLAAAGINPSVALGSSSRMASSTGTGSMSAPSAPNQSPTVVPNQQMAQLQAPQNTFAPIDTSRNVSEILNALANAGATVQNSDSTRKLVDAQVQELLSQKRLNNQEEAYKHILTVIQSLYGDAKSKAEIGVLNATFEKLLSETNLNNSQVLINRTLDAIKRLELKTTDLAYKIRLKTAEHEIQLIKNQAKTEEERAKTEQAQQGYYAAAGKAAIIGANAQATSSAAQMIDARASAQEKRALTDLHRQMTDESAQRTDKERFSAAREAINFLIDKGIYKIDTTNGRSYELRRLAAEAHLAEWNADHEWLNFVGNLIGSSLIGGSVAYGAYQTRQTAVDNLNATTTTTTTHSPGRTTTKKRIHVPKRQNSLRQILKKVKFR